MGEKKKELFSICNIYIYIYMYHVFILEIGELSKLETLIVCDNLLEALPSELVRILNALFSDENIT